MGTSSLNNEIKKPFSRAFRKAYIKRRDATTGLFEATWTEITRDVKRWGKIKKSVDAIKLNKITFNNFDLTVENSTGRYNPSGENNSLWENYASRQRTLVKIEAGFLHQTQTSGGIWTTTTYPTDPTAYIGVISGDIIMSDRNEIALPIKSLFEVFRQFPATFLTGLTSTGMTMEQFLTLLRDQTNGSGDFYFRPFFGDTTTNWVIPTTTIVYGDLNTTTADFVHDKNVWEIIQNLAETEDMVPYITKDGEFKVSNRNQNTSTAAWEFFGAGFEDSTFGHTIKRINSFGKKLTDYYARVELKWFDSNSVTSTVTKDSSFTISGSNDPWNFGVRTLHLENFLIPTSTVADSLATNIFNNVTSLKNEIKFTTSLIPQLEVLDRVEISYESGDANIGSRWDLNNWADDPSGQDLIWDDTEADAIFLNAAAYKLLSVEIDLDKLETRFIAKEV